MERPRFENTMAYIVAGGLGRRMGRVNKGLCPLGSRAMVAWVMEALAAQCTKVGVSANEDEARFLALGADFVLKDKTPDFQGPLASLEALYERADLWTGETPIEWILWSPCDVPGLPTTLLAAFQAAYPDGPTKTLAYYIRAGEHDHYTIALIHRSALASVSEYLASGERRVKGWLMEKTHAQGVTWTGPETAFDNLNTPEELRAWEETHQK